MKLETFKLFQKFMAVTMSPNDHEALAALKQANSLLQREGLNWERVLNRSIKIVSAVEDAPEDYREPIQQGGTAPEYDKAAIDDYIDIIERRANLKGDFEDTINSIIDQHRNGKRLSFKQQRLLRQTADR